MQHVYEGIVNVIGAGAVLRLVSPTFADEADAWQWCEDQMKTPDENHGDWFRKRVDIVGVMKTRVIQKKGE